MSRREAVDREGRKRKVLYWTLTPLLMVLLILPRMTPLWMSLDHL